MPRHPSVSSDLHIRIKKSSTLDAIKDLYKTKKFESINDIVNIALEKGLPAIYAASDTLPGSVAEKVSEQVIKHLSPVTDALLLNMKKITVLQSVQESMLGSMIQEFEFFLKTKGVTIDPRLLDEFRFRLPQRFEDDKQELIDRLFASIQESDDDE